MEGDAVSATVGVLVQNLIDVSKNEISLIRGLDKEANNLKKTLIMIQGSLDDAQKKFITDDAVKIWLQELEAVVFDADNVLDELSYRSLAKKMNTIRTDKKRVRWHHAFKHFMHRRHSAVRIKEINVNFESINKRATTLGLERRLAEAPAAPDIATSETDSVTVDPIFIGRDDIVSKIVERLTTPTEQALSILPIVGMGGLGKTTLARKVFNHEKIKTYFGHQIWVHVSQIFDAVTLFRKILISLKPEELVQVEISRESLLKMIHEALGAKTYVLVLDDVWNQDRQKWEGFMNSWSGVTSVKGNYILVTTRNNEVGSIVNSNGIQNLNGLSQEECWSIIKEKTFKGANVSLGFEAIGRSIAQRCQGLPLAANVVGGVLCDKPLDEWRKIEHNWFSNVGEDEDNISKILKLSYDYLSSSSLKKCFAYCSIFPKGTEIEREGLIQCWMAEGYLQSNEMEQGNKLVDILVQSSLLQVVDRDDFSNIHHCSMHDLVHDVAGSVLGFFEVNDNTSNGSCGARYILWKSKGDESSHIKKEQSKWVRTLLYNGDRCDIIFSEFKSLHVLILVGDIVKLSDTIRELIHLRFLNIEETKIETLPDSIGELYHLQTFKARKKYYSCLKKLPSTFKYLSNLRHLDLRDDTELPPKMGMLTSLQTLRCFKVRDEEGYRIVELGSLKNLKGILRIDNLEKVSGEDESLKACLFQKSGIVQLELRWGESRGDERNDESVLRGLQPHQQLKILEIDGFKGASFPSWTLKMEGLDNLMEIQLVCCLNCKEIPTLGHLSFLKSIKLSELKNVTSISSSFYVVNKCSSNNVFPALETLELSYMSKLEEWVEAEIPNGAEVKVFPCLKILRIEFCNKLKSAPSIFPCLKELCIYEMDSGVPLANICGIKLTSLVKLQIKYVDEMVSLPDWLFRNNQSLSVLEIEECPELRELPDGLQTLNSLEELEIVNCDNLESIPFSSGRQSQGCTLLRELRIVSRKGINVPCGLLERSASSLRKLDLRGRVTNMPVVIECMHKMPHLAELRMSSVPKFIISCPTELGSLRSLESLEFSAAESWDSVSFNNTVDEILRMAIPSLQWFELKGQEDWESLPDQLQHLTALSWLRLNDFGIEELPEWFENLSSLQRLGISYCKKLKRQPFVEVMQRLTNLPSLFIVDCPLLEGLDYQFFSMTAS